MNLSGGESWTPTAQMLAAYADGELDGRPELAELRCRLEQWLASHPETAADVEAQRDVSQWMAATTPAEPDPAVWQAMWSRIKTATPSKRKPAASWLIGLTAAGLAAAVLLMASVQWRTTPTLATNQVANQPPVVDASRPTLNVAEPQPETIEVLQVAAASEIEIIQVSGSDTETLVIGQPPLSGPLVLMQPGEVDIALPADTNTALRFGGGSAPMLWTRLPGEIDH